MSECNGSQPMTTSAVARLLGVSADRVRQLARNGQLPCQSTQLGRLFDRASVVAFQTERDRRLTA